MRKGKKYPHLYPDLSTWPVYHLHNDRKGFVNELRSHSRKILLKKFENDLQSLLERTAYLERKRIRTNPWKVDPQSDALFWKRIEKEIIKESTQSKEAKNFAYVQILDQIIRRYSEEIVGNFRIRAFRFARIFLTLFFKRIFTSIGDRKWLFFNTEKTKIENSMFVRGEVELLRKIFNKGNVVFVPTHSSNLDSILFGYVLDRVMGFPSTIYGAGLNLFDSEIVAYFMNRLGVYRIDRRKMNSIYLETLKSNSSLITQFGANALFFPGGTRSRSGRLESKVKYGLLGSLVEAQRELFEKDKTNKIIVVPVVLNNNFVFEASKLISQELRQKGKGSGVAAVGYMRSFLNSFYFIIRLFTKSTEVSVSFGKPMDVMGNYLDEEMNSRDDRGNIVELKEYYLTNQVLTWDEQREKIYTKQLGNRIISEYHRKIEVLCSNLIAYAAFVILRKKHTSLEVRELVRLDEKEGFWSEHVLLQVLEYMKNELVKLEEQDQILLSSRLSNSTSEILDYGLKHLGIYHTQRPLYRDKQGVIRSMDFRLLYFYHNRLEYLELDKKIDWASIPLGADN